MDNKINTEDRIKAEQEKINNDWLYTAPRLYIAGEGYVEAWWARELFGRLHKIIFVLRDYCPHQNPDDINSYRKGLINIALYGEPTPDEVDADTSTPSSHD